SDADRVRGDLRVHRLEGARAPPGAGDARRGALSPVDPVRDDHGEPRGPPGLSPVVHGEPRGQGARRDRGDHAEFARVLEPVNAALAAGPFLVGGALTAADVVMGGVLQWAEASGQLGRCDVARAYHERLRARPAYQRALA